MMKINALKICVLALLAVLFSACSTVKPSDNALVSAALKDRPKMLESYILGPGDVVNINVWRNPELSGGVPIRPDGKLSTTLVGDIVASGKTPAQLAEEIKQKLSVYIREPQVSVVVTGMQSYEFSSRVRVTGAVKSPISIPYRHGMTVMDVVLTAGGLNDFASGDGGVLYRQYQGKTVIIPVKLNEIFQEGDVTTNYELNPGDIITVPEKVL
ncbi:MULTISPECIES: XrtA/PEP-CTERM system exopolysaccharide export protein [unclassified Hahella]|uniref:XrtA/PEP-CTERM system exopolysaccharide export protein n=1 Tax=unclassified Hahella TaxID=2624107 RepID=UPI001C1EFD95|nr:MULTISPECIES: XrtA/PEP-CTERM system exopolysaccharide export protein [unclassified Hahella]MBU6950589.1 polysaccharide export protein [Hahella sp. HN01]MDG9667870.1 polysaccharide export protein [Hahella sp. CR1]